MKCRSHSFRLSPESEAHNSSGRGVSITTDKSFWVSPFFKKAMFLETFWKKLHQKFLYGWLVAVTGKSNTTTFSR